MYGECVPTIIIYGRVRFCIYPKDHRPAHVHVIAGEAHAKFEIITGQCISSVGFSSKALTKLSVKVLEHRKELMQAWKEFEGED